MPPNPNPYRPYGKCLTLWADLEILYEGGKKLNIVTDNTWKTMPHMVTMSNVYGSEHIDATKGIDGWNSVGLDDDNWDNAAILSDNDIPKGKLTKATIPPVKVIHSYEGVEIGIVNNRHIYDFSQNVSGMLAFEVKGTSGQTIKIYPAEKLGTDGDVDQMAKNWLPIDVVETYVVGRTAQWEQFEMTFTYFAGRYIAIEGLDQYDGTQIRNVRLNAISSAYENSGSFWCDDERYMKIYDLVVKAVEANMLSVHTDCPTIERFAWQEENHLMAPAIMYAKNVKSHWEKFLTDTRTAQHTASDVFYDMEGKPFNPGDGLIPAQAPCYIPNVLPVPGMGSFYDIIGWGSSIIIGTYWHYKFYGDKAIIIDNYDAGMKYFNYLKTKVNNEGFINHGLGDWGNPKGEYARENVETAFLYADAIILGRFADILGREYDKVSLNEYAGSVKDNYNSKLLVWNEEKGYWCYRIWEHNEITMTQASEAMPLFWGLVPDDKKDDVVKAFKDTLVSENAFVSGEVGLPYIIQTAREYGMNDIISQFILKQEHPSYYAFILDGETTLGEYWEKNPRSHCHDMMGHILEWYYNGIAGIIPLEPGFGRVLVKPYLPESMNEFKCTYKSAKGDINVHVVRKGKEIEVDVQVSEGIEYEKG
jgi:hypothetical protein